MYLSIVLNTSVQCTSGIPERYVYTGTDAGKDSWDDSDDEELISLAENKSI